MKRRVKLSDKRLKFMGLAYNESDGRIESHLGDGWVKVVWENYSTIERETDIAEQK